MISPEVKDAIENARSAGGDGVKPIGRPVRYRSFAAVRAIVLAVVQELPSDMTVADLCEELSIPNNQDEARHR